MFFSFFNWSFSKILEELFRLKHFPFFAIKRWLPLDYTPPWHQRSSHNDPLPTPVYEKKVIKPQPENLHRRHLRTGFGFLKADWIRRQIRLPRPIAVLNPGSFFHYHVAVPHERFRGLIPLPRLLHFGLLVAIRYIQLLYLQAYTTHWPPDFG